jgi:curved DNA-binding protein CbpA
MTTLYELLGALPHDDAEGLRAAFRRAVKGAHPDLRPGDPDAALKFRQIVRASEILGDAEQRAAYDDLLEVARLEHRGVPGHRIAARIHGLASGVIALSGALVVTAGGYLLFMHMSVASVASADTVDVATRASFVSAAGAPPATSVVTGLPAKPMMPTAAVPATSAGSLPAGDASRALGISADRSGHLNEAIADIDRALRLDPKFLPAYVDRGMIFYPTQKLNHAFPDATPAHGIEKAGHAKSAPTVAKKPPVDQAVIAASVPPLSTRRTAAQDPSRFEAFAAAMLR